MRSLTSNEVNFLIYRYLQESGFSHTAYNFAHEAAIQKFKIEGSAVPAGSLISFLQKGIQYMEIEAKIRHGSFDTVVEYESPLELLYPAIDKQKIVPRNRPKAPPQRPPPKYGELEDLSGLPPAAPNNPLISEDQVTVLSGHTHEVFICSWSPKNPNQLASGSGDATARIWTLPSGPCGKDATDPNPIVLQHATEEDRTSNRDVTTLDWSRDAQMLATGSYDGKARVWTSNGQLLRVLEKHQGPIFSLKWNKEGNYLLSGSVDTSAIVWDAKSGDPVQIFQNHHAPTLDVDWQSNDTFATCSTDKMIYVCKVGEPKPLKCFVGHGDEVNAIRWDPTGQLLASCSDDYSAKVWRMDRNKCVHSFEEHAKEIYTIKWSPTGPNTDYPNRDCVLASASFDATIKIWDVNTGRCVHSLTKHTDPVYSVAFSPDGKYLASGSFDRCLHIWSVKDGQLVKTYNGKGSIFEVCWNASGDRVAACFSNSITEEFTVCVLDMRI